MFDLQLEKRKQKGNEGMTQVIHYITLQSSFNLSTYNICSLVVREQPLTSFSVLQRKEKKRKETKSV